MKQIGTKQFDSNDVMSLHRDMTAIKTLDETSTDWSSRTWWQPSFFSNTFHLFSTLCSERSLMMVQSTKCAYGPFCQLNPILRYCINRSRSLLTYCIQVNAYSHFDNIEPLNKDGDLYLSELMRRYIIYHIWILSLQICYQKLDNHPRSKNDRILILMNTLNNK